MLIFHSFLPSPFHSFTTCFPAFPAFPVSSCLSLCLLNVSTVYVYSFPVYGYSFFVFMKFRCVTRPSLRRGYLWKRSYEQMRFVTQNLIGFQERKRSLHTKNSHFQRARRVSSYERFRKYPLLLVTHHLIELC